MIEKKDFTAVKVGACIVMGALSISTIACGLYLISSGSIEGAHFATGLGIGFGSTAVVAGAAGCAMRDRFFKTSSYNDEIVENDYLLKPMIK